MDSNRTYSFDEFTKTINVAPATKVEFRVNPPCFFVFSVLCC